MQNIIGKVQKQYSYRYNSNQTVEDKRHSVIYEGPYIFTHVVEKGGSDFLIPMQIFDERNLPCTRS